MSSKEIVLGNIRAALKNNAQSENLVTRNYRANTNNSNLLALAVERVEDYKAQVKVVLPSELTATIQTAIKNNSIQNLVVPEGIPNHWLPQNTTVLPDKNFSHEMLNNTDGVLTGCALLIAETGTIVLNHGQHQGRRAISLIPDYHLCVVLQSQIVDNLPSAMRLLHASVLAARPITFISGPSATSDIELSRVEGVHGPRTLEVIVVCD